MGKTSKKRARRDFLKLPHTEPVPVALFEAARVRRFMTPAEQGRWRLRHFTRTQEEHDAEVVRLYYGSDHPEHEVARAVQPGDYISLQRRMTDLEAEDVFFKQSKVTIEQAAKLTGITPEEGMARWIKDDVRWMPVMSDTHAEILEHHHPLNHATGRVLITGLGLGCLPHALLTKPDVTRIDIIDIDPDVIALTGHYLTDPRVHIWQGSAGAPQRIEALRREAWCWDYAWHDIWTHVSNKNLGDETAEHGLSYRTLFETYEPYADVQAAWAYELALDMERIHLAEVEEEREFRRKVKALPTDEAVQLLYHTVLADRIKTGPHVDPFRDKPVPDFLRRQLDPEGKLLGHIRKIVTDPTHEFWTKLDEPVSDELESLDHPNRHLEV